MTSTPSPVYWLQFNLNIISAESNLLLPLLLFVISLLAVPQFLVGQAWQHPVHCPQKAQLPKERDHIPSSHNERGGKARGEVQQYASYNGSQQLAGEINPPHVGIQS